MRLFEGGNVFKGADGLPVTQRINQTDVKPTVAWLEQLTGLPLLTNMLGTTGKKATSGDLDLAVDEAVITKDELVQRLSRWVTSSGGTPKEWVKKAGISVHFKTPINGHPKNGYVQTDFMFVSDLDYAQFIIAADPASAYTGMHRFLVLNSVGKPLGYKMTQTHGMLRRDNNEPVSKDPDVIAQMLLHPSATRDDITSVEKILAALKNDPKRDAKLADARDYFAKQGIPFNTGVQESFNDAYFLAKLRDRIVEKGMVPLIESQVLTEGARIDHPEDLVFDFGVLGAKQGAEGLRNVIKDPSALSLKWDGKPAIIFGRDQQGFVLTDKSAFTAKGYDGIARSPEQLEQIMRMRKGDRDELVAMYKAIWPAMRNTVAPGFQGFVLGDLLWTETPPLVDGYYVFTPNSVTYRVRADSALGKRIGQSKAGIAIHTYFSTTTSPGQPYTDTKPLSNSRDVVVLSPSFTNMPTVDNSVMSTLAQVDSFTAKHTNSINALLDPATLRSEKISDFPALMKKYVNDRVRQGSYNEMLPGFVNYIKNSAAISEGKRERMLQHIKENAKGIGAVFQIFLTLTEVKEKIIADLDKNQGDVLASIGDTPGHEGYVYASGSAPVKLVDRMKFSRANFLRHG